jgi:polyisoprenoid-binding protein YceI
MTWVKKIISPMLGLACILLQFNAGAQNYVGKSIKMSIFSSTPVEDIRAASLKGAAVLVAKTGELVAQLPIKSLEFDRKLMQEHFNENYMESDKYPLARFKGTIDPGVDVTKDGEYNVTVNGILSVHGVDKQRSITGKIIVKDGTLQIQTTFKVTCADHKIKIPTLIITKVAEVIEVKVDGKLNQIK